MILPRVVVSLDESLLNFLVRTPVVACFGLMFAPHIDEHLEVEIDILHRTVAQWSTRIICKLVLRHCDVTAKLLECARIRRQRQLLLVYDLLRRIFVCRL